MTALRTVLAEIVGLFVDDGRYAAQIVGCLVLAWAVLPRLAIPEAWKGGLLFLGLAAILVESVVRKARR